MLSAVLEAGIVVPAAFNDGWPVPKAVLGDIEQEILGLAGGFQKEARSGAWVNGDGKRFDDDVFVYTFTAPANKGLAGRLEAVARFVARACDQESVYIWLTGRKGRKVGFIGQGE